MERDLIKRLFDFAVQVIQETRKLPAKPEYKIGISLKEVRESNYWIRILIEINNECSDWEKLKTESGELKKILGSIYSKTSIQR